MFAIGDEGWPGLSKVCEEAGEVLQVIGKLVATHGEAVHWDGDPRDLRQRLVEETADLAAALTFVANRNFTAEEIQAWNKRLLDKTRQFHTWHEEEAQ